MITAFDLMQSADLKCLNADLIYRNEEGGIQYWLRQQQPVSLTFLFFGFGGSTYTDETSEEKGGTIMSFHLWACMFIEHTIYGRLFMTEDLWVFMTVWLLDN